MSVVSPCSLLLTLCCLTACATPQFRAQPCPSECNDSCDADGGCLTDAAPPDGGAPLVIDCVGSPCESQQTSGVLIPACCEAQTGACGLSVTSGLPFVGCYPKAAPGNHSEHCGALLDQVEASTSFADPANRKYDHPLAGEVVSFEGCCTPAGRCGLVAGSVELAGNGLEFGLGCIDVRRIEVMASEDAGEPADRGPLMPFCVPGRGASDAACPPKMSDAAIGLDLCASLGLVSCDSEADTPDWVCTTLGMPRIETGEIPTLEGVGCLEFLPEYASGCGAGITGSNCAPNVPTNLFGCLATTGPVPGVPEYVCGCGLGLSREGQCIPNVSEQTCGAEPFDGASVPGLPEYACGCGEDTPSSGRSCLPNIPEHVCGDQPVTAPVVGLPAYICGCGDGVIKPYCLPNVALGICGAEPVEADDPLPWPEFLCGCGEQTIGVGVKCISNVPVSRCGDIDIVQGPVAGVSNALCGCGEAVRGDDSCLSNVQATLCGAVARCVEGAIGSGSGSAGTCADGQVCVDNTGDGGSVGEPVGDDLGDACAP